jgi:uncharacterized membrane protein YkoI
LPACAAQVKPIKEASTMRKRIIATAVGLAAIGAATGVAFAGGTGTPAGGSRLDDGKDLASQAKISEQQAIDAAQAAESGALNEIDLEQFQGNLVYNVDVGKKDVKVDAATGKVVSSTTDD